MINNVCRTIIGNSNRNENKKNKKRRGGRVVRVRRGSDGVVKSLQMDQQHLDDLSSTEAMAEKKKKNAIALCKKRLNLIRIFHSIDRYDDIWNDDSTVQLQKLKNKNLTHLLKIFNVQGRAKLLTNGPMKAALSELAITQPSIDALKSQLLQQLEDYGEEYDSNDNALDSSFAGSSIAVSSIADNLIVDTSIANDSDISLVIDIDETSGNENSISLFLGSEISGGDIGSDINSGTATDNTAELIANLPKKRTVSFNPTLAVRTFLQQDASSSSSSDNEATPRQATVDAAATATTSSSSSEDEELELHLQRTRRTTRSRYKRGTRASNRSPSTRQQTTQYNNNNNNNNNNKSASPSLPPTLPPDASRSEASPPPPPPQLRRSIRHR